MKLEKRASLADTTARVTKKEEKKLKLNQEVKALFNLRLSRKEKTTTLNAKADIPSND
ncbi:hypothetical protein H6F32_19735 [Anabaena sp. FACHB-1237]|nr:hypothetical protein [Anabaena sp. FACHB-1237]